jgi:geranylgeranylglycerol-phosphate geranylgeranyltransferase
MSKSPVRGLVALLRLPYWLMTGGLSLLTAFAIAPASLDVQRILLIFFSMASITSAGFSINDYFDKESDAIIKPKRPIPSGALSLKQVILVSILLFAVGLFLGFLINLLCLEILALDSVLLLGYSIVLKRKSGLGANILVGLLVGTAFVYGEAALPQPMALVSFALYPICFGTMGGNVLRDILSIGGDSKVGYPTLPQKIGNKNSVRVAAFFFILTAVLAPLPTILGFFGILYLPLIVGWSVLLFYSSIRLMTSDPSFANVRKQERLITMSMILLPLALILEGLILL